MRGKALENGGGSLDVRITPACAGKSHFATNFHLNKRDHPRMCGEKWDKLPREIKQKGSPPRMRGKGERKRRHSNPRGITPAYAGKSSNVPSAFRCGRDHPRVCGEKAFVRSCCASRTGSPPRMRGKGRQSEIVTDGPRITPAYAGKRHLIVPNCLPLQDHPRVCGEKTKKIP